MSTGYTVLRCSDSPLEMMEFDPEYFKKCVNTETKDRAKERGLAYFNKKRWKVVLTDDPEEYGDLVEVFGLEDYLRKRLSGAI